MINRIFKKKTRSEIINDQVSHILKELLIHNFTNTELAIILNSIKEQGKSILESRKEAMEKEVEEIYKEIKETSNAIQSL